MDLRDLWRPGGGESKLTHRRLQVLIDHLPPESATKTAVRDSMSPADLTEHLASLPASEGYGPWSAERHMLAAVYDRLGEVVQGLAALGGQKPRPLEPYPRPGVAPKGQATTKQQDFMARRRAQINAEIRAQQQRQTGEG